MKRLSLAMLLALAAPTFATVTFDFESAAQLDSTIVSGNESNFIRTTAQAQSGTNGLRFDYSTEDAFQSWTYDLPFTIQDGTISVWFHDSIGVDGASHPTKIGGSIILEDKDSPQDFLAVEIFNGPYPFSQPGAPNYFLTRGNAAAASTFKSNYFGDRTIGWHQVVFTLAAAQSSVAVDGVQNADGLGVVAGPGTNKNLRLRFMAWSPTNGGSTTNANNWVNNPTPIAGVTIDPAYVTYDDLTITATTPTANSVTEGFEIVSGTATYDTPAVFMGPAAHDNPQMKNLVPQWGIVTEAAKVRTGAQALHFAGGSPLFKSLVFDLSAAAPGDITLAFHDALGADSAFDKVGGAVTIEQASDPRNFIALEIWNAAYPFSNDPSPGVPNYYFYRGTGAGNPADFNSGYFGNRSVGWQNVTISLTATTSKIAVNGVENARGTGIVFGPGLNDGLRLRLIADSPSLGGGKNWADPSYDELGYLYLNKTASYVTFDDIVLPLPAGTSVGDWQLF